MSISKKEPCLSYQTMLKSCNTSHNFAYCCLLRGQSLVLTGSESASICPQAPRLLLLEQACRVMPFERDGCDNCSLIIPRISGSS